MKRRTRHNAQPRRARGAPYSQGSAPRLVLRTAFGLWQRMKGLLGEGELGRNCGLWLRPCTGVHTLGMRQSLDVVFLDRHGNVVKVVARLRPGGVALCWRARSAVELPAGYCARHPAYAAAIRRACLRVECQDEQSLCQRIRRRGR